MSSPAPPPRKLPPYHWYGALAGALLLGLAGGGYGAYLYYSPEAREAHIRDQLSRPHMDSPRYVASILALRYRGFWDLVLRHALAPLVLGALAGSGIGGLVGWARHRTDPEDTPKPPPRFTLIELLVIVAIITVLMATLFPQPGAGLVRYQGKDQFYWLEKFSFGPEEERPGALAALCVLLEGKPFPCRTTILGAIGKRGPEAASARPVVKRLTEDPEESVRQAAREALEKISPVP